jgi:hypothetical protein
MSNELQQSGLSNDNTNIAVTVDKEKVKKALAQIQEIPDANRLSNVKKHSEVLENEVAR